MPGSGRVTTTGARARARCHRFVKRVERSQVFIGQREVEDLGVLLDPVAVRRLRDHNKIPLYEPAQKHLSRRAPRALGDLTGEGPSLRAASATITTAAFRV
jgi:hypothetical protein